MKVGVMWAIFHYTCYFVGLVINLYALPHWIPLTKIFFGCCFCYNNRVGFIENVIFIAFDKLKREDLKKAAVDIVKVIFQENIVSNLKPGVISIDNPCKTGYLGNFIAHCFSCGSTS